MDGDIDLHFVPTEYQVADRFTKSIDESRFNMLISELGMLNIDDQFISDKLYPVIQNEMI